MRAFSDDQSKRYVCAGVQTDEYTFLKHFGDISVQTEKDASLVHSFAQTANEDKIITNGLRTVLNNVTSRPVQRQKRKRQAEIHIEDATVKGS